MMKMKTTLVLALMTLSQSAFAYVTCAGETYAGRTVQVTIETVGSMGSPQSGTVHFVDANGATSSYVLKQEEIVQFFENADGPAAIVGLAAYSELNNPVWIKYVGKNYEGDLIQVLRDPNRKKQSGNEMRVWKGPGYGPTEQNQFMDVVCSVSLDV